MAQVRSRSTSIRDEIAARHRDLVGYYLKIGWTDWADREARLVDALESGEAVMVAAWEAGLGAGRHDIVTVASDGSIR